MRSKQPKGPLILVDSRNRVIGHADVQRCHDGDGLLHRAFSVFLFDTRGRVLLQRRSRAKRLWPGYWSNSCCSHPRRGESVTAAASRRLREELGVRAAVKLLYRFEYQAKFGRRGSEHELCSVLIATSDAPVQANPDEVEEWRFAAPGEVDRSLAANAGEFTPWMKLEWPRLRGKHWRDVLAWLRRA